MPVIIEVFELKKFSINKSINKIAKIYIFLKFIHGGHR